MADCPSDDALAGYLNDSLSPTVVGPLTAHIDGCPDCQARLDQITAGGVVADRFHRHPSVVAHAAAPDPAAATPNPVYDTHLFGPDGVPMVPRVVVVRPDVPGYEIVGELGRGGMGVVFKAVHKRLNRTVALKMVLAAGVADPRVTQRFLFEAEVLAKVQHPQVVQVYEVSMYTAPTGVTIPYLAMELLEGGTLLGWAGGTALPPEAGAVLVEGLARAVHAAHSQGIVHRDLKPANILRTADGHFKVSDFGLAKLTQQSDAGLTGTGTVVGTPAYMAPEQAAGDKQIGPTADVYSLGAILFELLTGRPPFEGGEPMSLLLRVIREAPPEVRALRPQVPRDLSAVVMKCLAKEPHRRYQSADDLADDLARFLNGRPTRARTLSAVERAWYWSRRNPGTAGLLASLAVVLVAGFLTALVLWRRAEGTAADLRRANTSAELSRRRAETQTEEAEARRKEADTHEAYLSFDQAVTWCEAGQIDDGLRGFVHALDLAERTGDAELRRVIRTNIAAWERELFPAGRRFRLGDPALTASGFSPDGRWVVATDGNCRVHVWEADPGRRVAALAFSEPLHLIERLPGVKDFGPVRPTLRGVAADPARKWVAACTSAGDLLVWSAADWKLAHRLPVVAATGRTAGDLWAVAFTADGRLWVGGDDGVLAGYDPATGRRVAALHTTGSRLFSALGSALGGAVWAPPPRPGSHPRSAPAPVADAEDAPVRRPDSFQAVCPSPDGRKLYTGDRSGRVIEWDLGTGRATGLMQFGGWVAHVAAGDRYVAACATDGTARVLDRAAPAPPWVIDLAGAYGRTVALSDDGRLLAVGDEDGKVVVYDVPTRSPVGGPLRLGLHSNLVALRPGSHDLLVPEAGGVRVQPLVPPATVAIPPPAGYQMRVRFLDYRPDGQALLVGNGRLRVYDPANGVPLSPPLLDEEPLCGRFAADGRRAVFGGRHFWGAVDLDGYAVRHRQSASNYVRLIPDRPTADAATVFLGRQLVVRAADTGAVVRRFTPECLDRAEVDPTAAVCSADGSEVWVAFADAVEFVDRGTGKSVRPPLRTADAVTDLARSADGRFAFVGLRDNAAQLWEVATGKPVLPAPVRHKGAVTAVAVSPDGRVLLTGSRDRTARFWDAATGLAVGPRRNYPQPVTRVAYSPTGAGAAVGTADGLTVVVPVPPPPDDAPLEELRARFAHLSGSANPPAGTSE